MSLSRVDYDVMLGFYSSVTLVVWDALICLGDEIQHIWKRPHIARAKGIYCFARWFGVLNQIGITLMYAHIMAHAPASTLTCRFFHAYQAFALIVMLTNLDILLLLRVRALYSQHRVLSLIGLFIIVVETVVSAVTCVLKLLETSTDAACINPNNRGPTIGMLVVEFVSQLFFLVLIIRKQAFAHLNQSRSLFWVVIRDSLIASALLMMTVASGVVVMFASGPIAELAFPWMPALVAIVTARIVFNMLESSEDAIPTLHITTANFAVGANSIALNTVGRL